MARRYEYLRMRLSEYDIDQKYLAEEVLHKSTAYVSERMSGKRPWGQDDQYAIMNVVNEPYERLHVMFPPEGKAVPNTKDWAGETRKALLEAAQFLTKQAASI